MTYAEAIQFLYDLRLFGLKLGLENTLALAALAGNPHRRLRFIHVAGTNGKGSTCAMLESVYRAAGLKVGLFTSPHLVSFRERIQVNRQLIPETEVVRLVREMKQLLGRMPADHLATFFEVLAVLALRYFEEQRCDLVIWETGLGGRLDATNIVTPLASVITNIQLDHQKWLGHTRAQIAAEKAGIIKPGVPVLTATDAPDALEVIERTAAERRTPLTRVSAPQAHAGWLADLELPLLGEHQRLNAALAIAVVHALAPILPVDEETLRRGLAEVHWPGRLQVVRQAGGPVVLLDGAHNAAGMEALRAALARYFAGERTTFILGVLADKDWAEMCRLLAPLAARVLLTPVKSERTAPPDALREACAAANPHAGLTVCASLPDALGQATGDPLVVVTGSLYLVGEAMEVLRLLSGNGAQERGLNEWTPGAREDAGPPAP
jgi:dihydrofolate synthase/folylpolyglutamate synthase